MPAVVTVAVTVSVALAPGASAAPMTTPTDQTAAAPEGQATITLPAGATQAQR